MLTLNNYKKIGISLSGGADSALLAFLAMKFFKNQIVFFTTASKEKKYITVKHSINVIKKCIELTNNNNVSQIIEYVNSQERELFLNSLLEKVNNNFVDVIITATTNIPSISDRDLFSNKLDLNIENRRSPLNKKPLFTNENKLYHPFINKDKKEIKKIYESFNLLDSLFPLTRSCESFDVFDKHCGKCWWCEERQWAFGYLE